MDGQAQGERAERSDELSFRWLHARVQGYVDKSHRPPPSRLEHWSLWGGLGMAGLGLAFDGLKASIPPQWVLWLVSGCLVAEVAGIGLSVFLMVRRELPQLARGREVHAGEMDADFAAWQRLVAELRRFPRSQREARLRFVSTLRQNMGERMGLLFGGIQRLGVFPILIALYLQFRDWEWGDWMGAFDVNLVGGLLIWATLLLYSAGWYLVGLRARLDSYVGLLGESLSA